MESNGVLKGFNRSQTLANFATYFQYIILFESFLSLRNQYLALNLMPECRKWHFRASRFQNFLGEHAPQTPLRGGLYGPRAGAYFRANRNPCVLKLTRKPLLVAIISNNRRTALVGSYRRKTKEKSKLT